MLYRAFVLDGGAHAISCVPSLFLIKGPVTHVYVTLTFHHGTITQTVYDSKL